jgi:predicted alpha/beta-hydrolase family hydrolase
MPEFLVDGPAAGAPLTVALAHGAGAPMDSPFMAHFASGLADAGWRVVRFEFPYMAASRRDGRRRPPDRTNVLTDCWRRVISEIGAPRLVIGGKSLGGRIASLVADEAGAAGAAGLVCLGYPFHPPGKPDSLRLDHLETLCTPALILQGARDPFGDAAEVAGYPLSPAIRVHWLADGDHGFRPRAASGRTEPQNWDEALAVLNRFLGERAGETATPRASSPEGDRSAP